MSLRGAGPRDVDVLILGAGLTGLSAAYHLARGSGLSALVAEKEGRAGGTSGSVSRGGFVCDRAGHLLHLHDAYGRRLAASLLRGNLGRLTRRAGVRLQGRVTPYPFQANTYGLPLRTVVDCVAGCLRNVLRPLPPLGPRPSFADWSLRQFGAGICRHFMSPYNRKLWGIPLDRLTADWQGRFVPRPAPAEVAAGALGEQSKGFGYNAVFHYPRRGGSQALADALAARLKPGVLRAASPATRVDLEARVAQVVGVGEVRYRRLVNTMPLPEFMDLCGPWPAPARAARRALRHTSVWCLALGVDRPDETGRHWTYFPERRYAFYRVGCYSAFSPDNAPAGTASYYVEVSRPGGARVDLPALERRVLAGLRDAGVLQAGDRLRLKQWLPIPYGYVVYDFSRAAALAAIFRRLDRLGVESIGRYGAWKYSFMEEALLDGKACAERLAGRRAPPAFDDEELRPL